MNGLRPQLLLIRVSVSVCLIGSRICAFRLSIDTKIDDLDLP